MIHLAFYKGKGSFADRVIRWVTRSAFSHVELLDRLPTRNNDGAWIEQAWSSSGRDGGVRGKEITFETDRWVIIAVPWGATDAIDKLRMEMGKPYDFVGLVGSQLFNLRRHSAGRWFCSELCAHALGLEAPQEFSPGSLYRRAGEMNRAYQLGMTHAGEPPEE